MVSTRRRSKRGQAAAVETPTSEVPEPTSEVAVPETPVDEVMQALSDSLPTDPVAGGSGPPIPAAEMPLPEEPKPAPHVPSPAPFEVPIPDDLLETISALYPDTDLQHPSPDTILNIYRTLSENNTKLAQQDALQLKLREANSAKLRLSLDAQKAEVKIRELTEAKDAAEGSVIERDAQVAALTQAKDATEALVQERDAAIRELTEQKATADASTGANEAQIRELTESRAAAEALAAEREATIRELTEAKAAADALAQSRETTIAELTAAKEAAEASFKEREEAICELTEAKERADAAVRESEAQIRDLSEAKDIAEVGAGEKDLEIGDLKEVIAAREGERDTALEKVHQAEERISQLQNENTHLKTQLEEVKTATQSSRDAVGVMQKQIDDLEVTRRRLVDMNHRLMEEQDHTKFTISTLEKSLRETSSNLIRKESMLASGTTKESIARAKNAALEEEIVLLRTENVTLKDDMGKQLDAWAKTRRDLASAKATTDEENARLDAQLSQLQITYSQLRTSYDTLLSSHHKAVSDLAELKATKEILQYEHQSSLSHSEEMRKAMERRIEELTEVVQNMEGDWDEEREEWVKRVKAAQEDGSKELESLAKAHERIQQLERALDEVGGAVAGGVEEGRGMLSRSAMLAIRAQKSGRTFSDIYIALIKTEEQLRREKEEHEALKAAFDSVVGQLAEKQPEIEQRTANYEKLEQQVLDLTGRLSTALSAHDESAEALRRAKVLAEEDKSKIARLQTSITDLSRQVRALTREVAIRDDPLLANELHPEFQEGWPEDRPPNEGAETADDIVNQATVFKDLRQLQERNVLLLRMTRYLGKKLEDEENNWDDQEKEALREAEDAIEALQSQVERKNSVIEGLREEADRWHEAALRQGGGEAMHASIAHGASLAMSRMRESALAVSVPNGSVSHRSVEEDEARREEFKRVRDEMGKEISGLKQENGRLIQEQSDTVVELARAKAQVDVVNDRLKMAQDEITRRRADHEELVKRTSTLQSSYAQLEAHMRVFTAEHDKIEARMNIVNNELHQLRAEKESWKRYEVTLQKQVDDLTNGKVDLDVTLHQMQSTLSGLRSSHENTVNRLSQQLVDVQTHNHDLQSLLNTANERLNAISADHEQDVKGLRESVEQLGQQLDEAKNALQQAEAERDQATAKMGELQQTLSTVNGQLVEYKRLQSERSERLAKETAAQGEALKTQHADEVAKLQAELEEARSSAKKAVDEAVKAAITKERQESTSRLHNVINQNVEKRLKRELEIAKATAEEEHAAELQELATLRIQVEELKSKPAEMPTPSGPTAEQTAQLAALNAQHAEELTKLRAELEETKTSAKRTLDEAVRVAIQTERSQSLARMQGIINQNVEKRLRQEVDAARAAAVSEAQTVHAADLRELEDRRLQDGVVKPKEEPASGADSSLEALEAQHAEELTKLRTELEETKASAKKTVDDAVTAAVQKERNEQRGRLQMIITQQVEKRMKNESDALRSAAIEEARATIEAEMKAQHAEEVAQLKTELAAAKASAVKTSDETAEVAADGAVPTASGAAVVDESQIEALKAQHAAEVSKLQAELEQTKVSAKKTLDDAVKAAVSKERSDAVTRVQNLIATRVKKDVDAAREEAAKEAQAVQAAHAAALQELQAKLESVQKEAQSRQDLNTRANKSWKDSVANLRKHLITCNNLLTQANIPIPPDIQKEVERAILLAQRAEAAGQNGTTAVAAPTAPVAAPSFVVPPGISQALAGLAPLITPTPPTFGQAPVGLPARPDAASPTVAAQPTPGGPVRFTRPRPFAAAVTAATQPPQVPQAQSAPVSTLQVAGAANGLKRAREAEEAQEAAQQAQGIPTGPGQGPKRQRIFRQTRQQTQQQQGQPQ